MSTIYSSITGDVPIGTVKSGCIMRRHFTVCSHYFDHRDLIKRLNVHITTDVYVVTRATNLCLIAYCF